MEQHVNVDDRHLGIIQQVSVFGQYFFFENLVDLRQQPNIKAGIAAGPQQGHHQRFDSRMGGPKGIR